MSEGERILWAMAEELGYEPTYLLSDLEHDIDEEDDIPSYL